MGFLLALDKIVHGHGSLNVNDMARYLGCAGHEGAMVAKIRRLKQQKQKKNGAVQKRFLNETVSLQFSKHDDLQKVMHTAISEVQSKSSEVQKELKAVEADKREIRYENKVIKQKHKRLHTSIEKMKEKVKLMKEDATVKSRTELHLQEKTDDNCKLRENIKNVKVENRDLRAQFRSKATSLAVAKAHDTSQEYGKHSMQIITIYGYSKFS